ncbi:MAG: single-stranded DNA-binding protein [Ignavibacteriales bacterium]|nr:single-stranded DNA-binding protein [Ignavibacteriales bacterium]
MAFSLNKIMLIGNLGQDAETTFTTNNISVTKFSLATTYSYKNKDGEWTNETTWHNITAYSLSDFYKEALKKGKKFYVEGRLSKRDYTDKDNVKRYYTDVIAQTIIPLDSSGGGSNYQPELLNKETPPEESAKNDDLPF